MPKQPKTSEDALTRLAENINLGHQKCLRAVSTSLEAARQTGTLLLEAKEKVTATGKKWLDWVQQNCKFSVSESQRYMRIANHYSALLEQGKDLTKLSLTKALRLLSPADRAGKGRGTSAKPFKVASEADVRHLVRRAEALAVPEDCPERKFLDDTVAGLAQKILVQAKATHLTDGRGEPLSPQETAVALLEWLKGALQVGLVVRVKATEPQRSDTPAPNGQRANGRAHAAV